MNKKLFLSIILLTAFSVGLRASKTIQLQDPVLQLVDGIPGAMEAGAINKCFKTWTDITKIQYEHTYNLNGKQVTLKDVVILEAQYKKNGIPLNSPQYQALQKTLTAIKADFTKDTEPLLKEAESNPVQKQNNKKLVDIYTKKTQLVDSLLNSWGQVDATELLDKADSKTFFVFLNHLKGFLKSLMFSCVKARTMFKKECLKEADHASFDTFFTN